MNIKTHLSKRYGKVISDRIIAFLESCNKTMHNIEYNGYLDLIWFSFFTSQNVTINGEVHQVPNMYRMMYQIFDSTNKGFICEHDLFQILWSINSATSRNRAAEPLNSGQSSQDETLPTQKPSFRVGISSYAEVEEVNLNRLTANFVDTFPQIKRSIFVEAFQQDYTIMTAELSRIKIMSIHSKASTNAIMSLLANAMEQSGRKPEEVEVFKRSKSKTKA
jgi:hypothetical protein